MIGWMDQIKLESVKPIKLYHQIYQNKQFLSAIR